MTTEFLVEDATCGHCKLTIESVLSAIDGITHVNLNLDTQLLQVDHDASLPAQRVAEAIASAGYAPKEPS